MTPCHEYEKFYLTIRIFEGTSRHLEPRKARTVRNRFCVQRNLSKSERVEMPMITKTKDAISRSDRVLVAAMAIVLATASAAVGSSLGTRPHTDQVRVITVSKPVVKVVQAPAI